MPARVVERGTPQGGCRVSPREIPGGKTSLSCSSVCSPTSGTPTRHLLQVAFPDDPDPPFGNERCPRLLDQPSPLLWLAAQRLATMTLTPDTRTGKGPHLAGVAARVVCAGGPVLAGAGRALVHLVLAVAARVASRAAAVVRVACIHAQPSVPTQAGHLDTCRGHGSGNVRPGRSSRDGLGPHPVPARWGAGEGHSQLPCCHAATSQETLGTSQ